MAGAEMIPPLSFTGGADYQGDTTINPDFGNVSVTFGPFRGASVGGGGGNSFALIALAGVLAYVAFGSLRGA